MNIRKVGVIGCGAMGAGIAQVVLQGGYDVIVREMDETLLSKGIERVRTSFEKLVTKQTLTRESADAILKKLGGTVSLEPLADCDLIIEAIFENLQAKTDQFKALDRICETNTIFASNTSSFSVSQMAAPTSRPSRFIGLHFFNPAPVMPLVEVIRTIRTEQEVFDAAFEFVKSLKKTPIVAKDNAGFIVNLLLTPFLLDAIRALQEGVASAADIDAGMKLGCNHPMGPLMLADFIGLDVLLSATYTLFEEYKEKRYAAPPLMKRMVTLGSLGLKTGKGFYDWSDPRNPKPMNLGL
jgi:3-hydroxybutyryl-CoA dehydrogenase